MKEYLGIFLIILVIVISSYAFFATDIETVRIIALASIGLIAAFGLLLADRLIELNFFGLAKIKAAQKKAQEESQKIEKIRKDLQEQKDRLEATLKETNNRKEELDKILQEIDDKAQVATEKIDRLIETWVNYQEDLRRREVRKRLDKSMGME